MQIMKVSSNYNQNKKTKSNTNFGMDLHVQKSLLEALPEIINTHIPGTIKSMKAIADKIQPRNTKAYLCFNPDLVRKDVIIKNNGFFILSEPEYEKSKEVFEKMSQYKILCSLNNPSIFDIYSKSGVTSDIHNKLITFSLRGGI